MINEYGNSNVSVLTGEWVTPNTPMCITDGCRAYCMDVDAMDWMCCTCFYIRNKTLKTRDLGVRGVPNNDYR